MRTPIKVKLVRTNEATYRIVSIVGTVTLGLFNGRVARAGDSLDEKEAERLAASYHLTVVNK